MVGVAQLVEHSVVVRDVAGSSPVAHPTISLVVENSRLLGFQNGHELERAGLLNDLRRHH